jgi:outer membrane protein assembly factor BamB
MKSLFCLDISTGSRIWECDLNRFIYGITYNKYGYIIVEARPYIFAVDCISGKIVWSLDSSSIGVDNAWIACKDNGNVIVRIRYVSLEIDGKNGQIIRDRLMPLQNSIINNALSDRYYVECNDNIAYVMNSVDMTHVRRIDNLRGRLNSILIIDDLLICNSTLVALPGEYDSWVSAYSLLTGEVVFEERYLYFMRAQPCVSNSGKIYFATSNGAINCIE